MIQCMCYIALIAQLSSCIIRCIIIAIILFIIVIIIKIIIFFNFAVKPGTATLQAIRAGFQLSLREHLSREACALESQQTMRNGARPA